MSDVEENVEKSFKFKDDGSFDKGTAPGPGRPPGMRNYKTIYREALVSLAERENKTPEQIESMIVQRALIKAQKGDYQFYKDVQDRLHGRPKEFIDHTSGGKPIPILGDIRATMNVQEDNGDEQDSKSE